MTKIGDLLGPMADELTQGSINVGDVHLIALDETNGITPKGGETAREKFFVVLGFDGSGNVIGGLVINSKINYNLPSSVTDYQLPVTVQQCPFLQHDSFVNCSHLITAGRNRFGVDTYRGSIEDEELLGMIVDTVRESPTVNKKLLKEFGI